MSGGRPRVEIVVEQLRREVPGGIGTYCRGLVAGLSALHPTARPEVSLFASRPPHPGADPLERLGLPVRSSRLPGAVMTRLWDRRVPVGFLDGRRGGAVLHATSFAFPPLSGRRSAVMVHDLAWRRLPGAYPARGRAWHEQALRRAAATAAGFVVPSEATGEDLLGAGLGIKEGRVRVIEEGVDHLEPPDGAAADALLDRLSLRPADGFLLTVGTLEPRKNLGRLVEAYELARPRLAEPWPLLVVGPPGWGDTASSGVLARPGVVPVGRLEGGVLTALYGRARCVAYVPLVEGFGLPAVEAMAAGAPVVATAGLPSPKGAALEADPLDAAAIAEAIVTASLEGAEREQLRSAGLRRAAELRWSDCAAGHVALWAELAR